MRFATFRGESVPIVEQFEKLGKVRKVDALHAIDVVYEKTVEVFKGFV